MSKRDQYSVLSGAKDALTSKVLPEGFEQAFTSAGNVLAFTSPAEKNQYINANPSQFKNQGEGDVRRH